MPIVRNVTGRKTEKASADAAVVQTLRDVEWLRVENEQLVTREADLKGEVAELQDQIAALEAQAVSLTKQAEEAEGRAVSLDEIATNNRSIASLLAEQVAELSDRLEKQARLISTMSGLLEAMPEVYEEAVLPVPPLLREILRTSREESLHTQVLLARADSDLFHAQSDLV